jgi:hypothetical protein
VLEVALDGLAGEEADRTVFAVRERVAPEQVFDLVSRRRILTRRTIRTAGFSR